MLGDPCLNALRPSKSISLPGPNNATIAMPHFTYELCNKSKNVPWPIWMPSEWRRWDACEPQQSATSVHAKATRPRLRVRSSAFLAAISLHLRALSPAPAAAPPRRAAEGNPHSVSLAASSSPAPGAGDRSRTAADSARRLTAAVSTRASAARMDRTRAAQPPHIMPLTSRRTAALASSTAAGTASTALEAEGSAVARRVAARRPRERRWRRWEVEAERRLCAKRRR